MNIINNKTVSVATSSELRKAWKIIMGMNIFI